MQYLISGGRGVGELKFLLWFWKKWDIIWKINAGRFAVRE